MRGDPGPWQGGPCKAEPGWGSWARWKDCVHPQGYLRAGWWAPLEPQLSASSQAFHTDPRVPSRPRRADAITLDGGAIYSGGEGARLKPRWARCTIKVRGKWEGCGREKGGCSVVCHCWTWPDPQPPSWSVVLFPECPAPDTRGARNAQG